MKVSFPLVALFGVVSMGFAAEVARLNEFVAVSATSAPDYQRAGAGGALRPETYVFMEGHRFASSTVDGSVDSATFTQLVQKLAPDLAKQKYFPTKDVSAADLLIVVYWGTTLVYDDPQRERMLESMSAATAAYTAAIREAGMADPGELNHISESLSLGRDNAEAAVNQNAALLGYNRSFHRFGQNNGYLSEKEKFMRIELGEERYFVVLMAYDNQALRKDKTRKLRWVTRLSVRTPGNNFVEALPVLAQAGSHVFGKQTDNLVHLKANLREGRVDIGELRVVETAAPDSLQH